MPGTLGSIVGCGGAALAGGRVEGSGPSSVGGCRAAVDCTAVPVLAGVGVRVDVSCTSCVGRGTRLRASMDVPRSLGVYSVVKSVADNVC